MKLCIKELVHKDQQSNFNVLDWWKVNESKLKTLSRMAKDILSIQMTFVAYESSFGIGDRVINEDHNLLLASTVEALTCTDDWLRDLKCLMDDYVIINIYFITLISKSCSLVVYMNIYKLITHSLMFIRWRMSEVYLI